MQKEEKKVQHSEHSGKTERSFFSEISSRRYSFFSSFTSEMEWWWVDGWRAMVIRWERVKELESQWFFSCLFSLLPSSLSHSLSVCFAIRRCLRWRLPTSMISRARHPFLPLSLFALFTATPTFFSLSVMDSTEHKNQERATTKLCEEKRVAVKLLQSVIIRITKCCNFFNSPKTFHRGRIIFLISARAGICSTRKFLTAAAARGEE